MRPIEADILILTNSGQGDILLQGRPKWSPERGTKEFFNSLTRERQPRPTLHYCHRPGASYLSQLSTTLPPAKRKMPMASTSTRSPDGGTLLNRPRWVALTVQRAATLSPSARMSFMKFRVSGKAESHSLTNRLRFSRPVSWGFEGVRST